VRRVHVAGNRSLVERGHHVQGHVAGGVGPLTNARRANAACGGCDFDRGSFADDRIGEQRTVEVEKGCGDAVRLAERRPRQRRWQTCHHQRVLWGGGRCRWAAGVSPLVHLEVHLPISTRRIGWPAEAVHRARQRRGGVPKGGEKIVRAARTRAVGTATRSALGGATLRRATLR